MVTLPGAAPVRTVAPRDRQLSIQRPSGTDLVGAVSPAIGRDPGLRGVNTGIDVQPIAEEFVEVSARLAAAEQKQRSRQGTVNAARALMEFKNALNEEARRITLEEDITSEQTLVNFGRFGEGLLNQTVAAHVGTEDTKANLAADLLREWGKVVDSVAVTSTTEGTKLVDDAIDLEMAGAYEKAANDSGAINEGLIEARRVVAKSASALGADQARDKERDLRQQVVMSGITGRLHRGGQAAAEDAADLLDIYATELEPEQFRSMSSLIAGRREALRKERLDRADRIRRENREDAERIMDQLGEGLARLIEDGIVDPDSESFVTDVLGRPQFVMGIAEAARLRGESPEKIVGDMVRQATGVATPSARGTAAAEEKVSEAAGIALATGRTPQDQTNIFEQRLGVERPVADFLDETGRVKPDVSSKATSMVANALGGTIDQAGRLSGLEEKTAAVVPAIVADVEKRLAEGTAESLGAAVAGAMADAEIPRGPTLTQIADQLIEIAEPTSTATSIEQVESDLQQLSVEDATGVGSALVNLYNQVLTQVPELEETGDPAVTNARMQLGLLVGDFIRAERRSSGRIAVWEQSRLQRIFSDPSIWRAPEVLRTQLQELERRMTTGIEQQKKLLEAPISDEAKQRALDNIMEMAQFRARVRQFDLEPLTEIVGGGQGRWRIEGDTLVPVQ